MHGSIFMKNLIRNITFWRKNNIRSEKPKALLHIGVEKTGTTTIQEFLHLNRNLLANQGILFPQFIGPRNHRKLAVYCCHNHRSNQFTQINNIDDPEKRKAWKTDFSRLFEQELNRISNGHRSIIFSSEHFSTLLKEKQEIQQFKTFLNSFTSSFKVIIYIRRQDLLASSMTSNAAKSGIGIKLPLAGEIFRKHFYNYNQLIERWTAVFGRNNICLRIFEKEQLINRDLIQDFMVHAGIQQDENFVIPRRMNTSISATATEVAWLFNKRFPVSKNNYNLHSLRKLRLELIEEINKKYPGKGKMLLKEDAKNFLKHYEILNWELAKNWFDRDELFNEDFSMYPENEPKTNHQLIEHLVDDFVTRKKPVEGQ